jgi:hypothetical protein
VLAGQAKQDITMGCLIMLSIVFDAMTISASVKSVAHITTLEKLKSLNSLNPLFMVRNSKSP